jgi:hypothetical protein
MKNSLDILNSFDLIRPLIDMILSVDIRFQKSHTIYYQR